MISESVINKSLELVKTPSEEYFSKTRDVFSARLDSYIAETGRYLEAAVIGEIGNNTFDHNLTYDKPFLRGAYFCPNFLDGYAVLADFGRGILDSLKTIRPDLQSDEDALRCAFTEEISGRAPEMRGNGLKFVLKTCVSKKWDLFYTTGNAFLSVSDGNVVFNHNGHLYQGCLAILDFGGKNAC